MLMEEPTPEMLEKWKKTWIEYKDKLRPNRKSGQEVVEYLKNKYIMKELNDNNAKEVVIDNLMNNKLLADKLPVGAELQSGFFCVEGSSLL